MITRRMNLLPFRATQYRGLIIATIAFAVLFTISNLISSRGYSFFDFSYQSSGGATLALAAMGQTLVILHWRVRPERWRGDLASQRRSRIVNA